MFIIHLVVYIKSIDLWSTPKVCYLLEGKQMCISIQKTILKGIDGFVSQQI